MSEEQLEDVAGRIKPRAASNLLLWSIVGFFILAIVWAAFTKLDRTAHGQGRVVPTARLQVVSNLEGGIVEKILVRAGQQVRVGTPLIQLDQTAAGAEAGANESAFAALQAKVARLEAEIGGNTPRFPVSTDPAVNDQIAIERSLYLSRQSELASLTGASSARTAQASRAIAEAQAAYDAAVVNRDRTRQEADMLRPLVRNGIEPQASLIRADGSAAVAASQVAQAAASLARARATLSEARAQAAQIRQDWIAKSAGDLATAQADLAARRRALPALADKLRRTVVRAQINGQVNRVLVSTVGGTVRPSEPLVEIVPAEQGITVEAMVRPEDIAFVRKGQRALVKITAYDYAVYGGLEGQVVLISPDSTLDERTGQSFYTVRVQTRGTLRDQSGRALDVGPGMIADVNMIGDKRSVLSYLMSPITRLSENAFRER